MFERMTLDDLLHYLYLNMGKSFEGCIKLRNLYTELLREWSNNLNTTIQQHDTKTFIFIQDLDKACSYRFEIDHIKSKVSLIWLGCGFVMDGSTDLTNAHIFKKVKKIFKPYCKSYRVGEQVVRHGNHEVRKIIRVEHSGSEYHSDWLYLLDDYSYATHTHLKPV